LALTIAESLGWVGTIITKAMLSAVKSFALTAQHTAHESSTWQSVNRQELAL